MKRPVLTLFLALAVMALAGAQVASAGHGHGHGHGHHHGHRGHGVVFVQTNQPGGNAIAVYDRSRVRSSGALREYLLRTTPD